MLSRYELTHCESSVTLASLSVVSKGTTEVRIHFPVIDLFNSSIHSRGKELFTSLFLLPLTADYQLDRDVFRSVPLAFKLIVTFKGCMKKISKKR